MASGAGSEGKEDGLEIHTLEIESIELSNGFNVGREGKGRIKN